MHLLKEKDRPVVRVLLNAGCCPRCVLRFCCVGLQSTYRQSYKDLMKELTDFARVGECKKSNAETEEENDPPCKKIKLEETEDFIPESDKNGTVTNSTQECLTLQKDEPKTCVVCLGVLQHFCDKDFAKQMSRVVESANYQFSSLVVSVSLPAQLSVRESVFTRMAVIKALEKIKEEDFRNNVPDIPCSCFLFSGRPFAIELLNPHRATFTKEEIKNLQQTINKSSDKIKVRDLQIVTREAMVHMKEGEEGKTKCYNALIWTEKAIKTSDIEFINNIKSVDVDWPPAIED
ncbi:putative tRNA pseudouridine synthase Pus10 [Acipenser ruthenus]|uniref:tRNA pseudouridine(55) synthase n=1 Tax=Acipenser ruthenus TaxID=7906 RepID=A0A444U148_ACIRT|nr:putative tRNA pseudouridine synthase Pus10 [Acipenser ruthenus]